MSESRLDRRGRLWTAIGPLTTPGHAGACFRISRPGAYRLACDLAGIAGKVGIEIASSHVTLDLTGHTLVGVPGSLDGIRITAPTAAHVVIRGGVVRCWGGDGVEAILLACGRVEGIFASQNAGCGINVGQACTVAECSASSNDAGGISVGAGSRVERCVARENGDYGISAEDHCAIESCAATANAGRGIRVREGTLVVHCTASGNRGRGICADRDGNLLVHNAVHGNEDASPCLCADMNNDGSMDAGDVGPFVTVLLTGTGCP